MLQTVKSEGVSCRVDLCRGFGAERDAHTTHARATMSLDVRLPPPSEATGSGGGTRARDATRASGAASASASRSLSSGDVAGGTARSARADVATAKSATARGTTGAASTKASARTRVSSGGTARVAGASTAKSSAVRQPLAAVPGSDGAAPSKLGAAVQMPEKFCACCRGPHRRGSAPLAPLSVTQRARAKRETCPPSEFARLYAKSALPAEKNSGAFGGAESIRWRRQGWPEVAFDAARWLPVFVEGARVTTEPQRMIAMEGTKQILRSTPRDVILPLVPSLVPPLRAALNTHDPPAVAAALEIVKALISAHEDAVDVLIDCDGFRRLLPVPNTMAACAELVRVGYEKKIVGGERRRLDLIVDESLRLMADAGGARGLRLIKSYIPTFDPEKPRVGGLGRWGRRKGR